jgi:hypothetical protein
MFTSSLRASIILVPIKDEDWPDRETAVERHRKWWRVAIASRRRYLRVLLAARSVGPYRREIETGYWIDDICTDRTQGDKAAFVLTELGDDEYPQGYERGRVIEYHAQGLKYADAAIPLRRRT